MDTQKILDDTKQYVRQTLEGEGSGHDWWHIFRVHNLAKRIGEAEKADMFVVELGALLHDIADWKFHGGDHTVGPRVAREWLGRQGADEPTIAHVCDIVGGVSFKGAGVPDTLATLEGHIVQDADRLDAIGAIGIGRAFTYGGHKSKEMHNPNRTPTLHTSFEAYASGGETTINHFYEKLLLLKERMHTDTAKSMANARHEHMEKFLDQFFAEWRGEL